MLRRKVNHLRSFVSSEWLLLSECVSFFVWLRRHDRYHSLSIFRIRKPKNRSWKVLQERIWHDLIRQTNYLITLIHLHSPMRNPITTKKFEKDYIRQHKRWKDIAKLKNIIRLIIDEVPLDQRFRDHPLWGSWQTCRECHIEPDWLLIYRVVGQDVFFERTGSHSDLF